MHVSEKLLLVVALALPTALGLPNPSGLPPTWTQEQSAPTQQAEADRLLQQGIEQYQASTARRKKASVCWGWISIANRL